VCAPVIANVDHPKELVDFAIEALGFVGLVAAWLLPAPVVCARLAFSFVNHLVFSFGNFAVFLRGI
jgi:hypothetical protein